MRTASPAPRSRHAHQEPGADRRVHRGQRPPRPRRGVRRARPNRRGEREDRGGAHLEDREGPRPPPQVLDLLRHEHHQDAPAPDPSRRCPHPARTRQPRLAQQAPPATQLGAIEHGEAPYRPQGGLDLQETSQKLHGGPSSQVGAGFRPVDRIRPPRKHPLAAARAAFERPNRVRHAEGPTHAARTQGRRDRARLRRAASSCSTTSPTRCRTSRKIFANGHVRRPRQRSRPPITVPAWACAMTGKTPGQLGIYGFRNRKDTSYDGLAVAHLAVDQGAHGLGPARRSRACARC